eukprot:CAMPEP_0201485788 /NCGR_PEP_ID=MMETSP0151_2-20130828/9890_1 /ASSEMBLY_ACC=CAM_ASM_000257 /TAXON_ID=200890 /ORGANISM="Paramoeba atlantica, Strain 621/1 / CCAP 1560/9" /LENGTH=313 /DNA_ID=CAMNT_0047870103 /DNA_START=168 /DNA_END=1106 /DNA_ORIENTATION=-
MGMAQSTRLFVTPTSNYALLSYYMPSRGYQMHAAPLVPPQVMKPLVVVPPPSLNDGVPSGVHPSLVSRPFLKSQRDGFERSEKELQEFRAMTQELIELEFGKMVASSSVELADDNAILTAFYENKSFQDLLDQLSFEDKLENQNKIDQKILVPRQNAKEANGTVNEEEVEKEILPLPSLSHPPPKDDEKTQEKSPNTKKSEKGGLSAASSMLKIGASSDDLDFNPEEISEEERVGNEIGEAVCCVHCNQSLPKVNPQEEEQNGNVGGLPPPVSPNRTLSTMTNAIKSKEDLLSLLLPITSAIVIGSILYRSGW